MRYERDNSISVAAGLIYGRVRDLPEFAEGRALVVAAAIEECRGLDIAAMRDLGGFTSVIERHIGALPAVPYRVAQGSKLIPLTVSDALRLEVPTMRWEVQNTLAKERL